MDLHSPSPTSFLQIMKTDDMQLLTSEDTSQNSFQLSQDLVVEILCKLPLKSLLRFKAVSKSWKLLIEESPLLINKKTPLVYCFPLIWSNSNDHPSTEDSEFYPQLLFHPNHICHPITILGSSNGLVCLRTSHPFKRYLIFNPITKHLSFLPPTLPGAGPDSFFACSEGFYFVSETQEFRLLSFETNYWDSDDVPIWILTLGKTHSWREIRGVLPGLIMDDRYAISETTIYWLGLAHGDIDDIVICFDFVDEKFREISLPPSATGNELCRFLTVVEGSVNMIVYPLVKSESFDIWVLDDCETWFKQRSVGPLEMGGIMRPIDVWSDHEKLMVICSKTSEESDLALDFFYYNLETNEIGDFVTSFPPEDLRIISFVESLVSVEGLVPYIDSHVPYNHIEIRRGGRGGRGRGKIGRGRGRGRGRAASLYF